MPLLSNLINHFCFIIIYSYYLFICYYQLFIYVFIIVVLFSFPFSFISFKLSSLFDLSSVLYLMNANVNTDSAGATISSLGTNTVITNSQSNVTPIRESPIASISSKEVPFVFTIATIMAAGTNNLAVSYDPSTHPRLAEFTSRYARAQFTELSLVLIPAPPLIERSLQVNAVWTHSGMTPTAQSLSQTVGATNLSFGGAFNLMTTVQLDCPLSAMSTTFKDVVNHNYLPRATYYVSTTYNMQGVPPTPLPVFTIQIKGKFTFDDPLVSAWV